MTMSINGLSTGRETLKPSGDSRPRLELNSITKRYGSLIAVDAVSLNLQDGEFLTFLGQSGSGKSTILKMVAGFEGVDRGDIRISGVDAANKPPRLREIGMVFQQYALFPHMTVADNIAYGLRRRKWSATRRRSRTEEMLNLIRLGDLGDRYPRQLSGGQQQRVAVARALAFEPQLLLMDEPLGALDRALRLDMEQELRRIHRTAGCSVLYVTHDRDEALALSDRIAVFHEGRLVCLDSPKSLYLSPPTSYTARLLTDANLVAVPGSAKAVDGAVELIVAGQTVRVEAHSEVGARSRLAIPRTAIALTDRNGLRVQAEVSDLVFLGEHMKVDLVTETLGPLIAHLPTTELAAIVRGQKMEISVDTQRCSIVD